MNEKNKIEIEIEKLQKKQSRLANSVNSLKKEKEDKVIELTGIEAVIKDRKKAKVVEKSKELQDIEGQIVAKRELLVVVSKKLSAVKIKVSKEQEVWNGAKIKAQSLIKTCGINESVVLKQKREMDNLKKDGEKEKKEITEEIENLKDTQKHFEESINKQTVRLRVLDKDVFSRNETLKDIKNDIVKQKAILADRIKATPEKEDVNKLRSEKSELNTSIFELSEIKDKLTKDNETLSEERAKVEKDKVEFLKLRGAVKEKENQVNERLAYLKQMYGKVDLPW